MIYKSPGVYVEEVESGPKPVAGAPTSVAAIVGNTELGPANKPVRLISFAEYQTRFGSYMEGSYTAESVWGFFENGGSACYVVRADASSPARWQVTRADGGNSFAITASSPGTWGNQVVPRVRWQVGSGNGTFFGTEVTEDVDLNAPHTIQVRSTVGAVTGMAVKLKDVDGKQAAGTISAIVGDKSLTIDTASTDTFAAGATQVFATLASADTSLELSRESGLGGGDHVLLVRPDSSDTPTATVESLSRGETTSLTLTSNLGANVDTQAFRRRQVRYRAHVGGGASFAMGAVTWAEPVPRLAGADLAAGDYMVAPNGVRGMWSTTAPKQFNMPGDVPAGDVTIVAGLVLHRFVDAAPIPANSDLNARYGYLPVGTRLRLTKSDDSTFEAERGAAGLTTADADDLKAAIKKVECITQADRMNAAGLIVRATHPPQEGDLLGIKDNNKDRIESVKVPEGAPPGVYHVKTVTDDLSAHLDDGVAKWPVFNWQPARVESLRFDLELVRTPPGGPAQEESYDNLSLSPSHRNHYAREGVINEVSALVTVSDIGDPGADIIGALPASVTQSNSGTWASATAASLKAGIKSLEQPEEPSQVMCPDALLLENEVETVSVHKALIGHCEKMRRFAVVDLPNEPDDQKLLAYRQANFDTTHGACYAPWVTVLNPRPNAPTLTLQMPPSGFVCGVIGRTDQARGVHKAPANERVKGIVGLARDYTQGHQDLLNPKAVNLVRAFRGRGIRIWGARNLTTDTQWRYVNVRRLFNFIETSIDRGTQWVVFEPNNEKTWLRVRVAVENFLNTIWRAGGLAGTAPEQAYRVRVGLGVTMTETDIDLGKCIIEVGVAPTKPAEFVVFRISHKRITE